MRFGCLAAQLPKSRFCNLHRRRLPHPQAEALHSRLQALQRDIAVLDRAVPAGIVFDLQGQSAPWSKIGKSDGLVAALNPIEIMGEVSSTGDDEHFIPGLLFVESGGIIDG